MTRVPGSHIPQVRAEPSLFIVVVILVALLTLFAWPTAGHGLGSWPWTWPGPLGPAGWLALASSVLDGTVPN